jgi:hypothetical protein
MYDATATCDAQNVAIATADKFSQTDATVTIQFLLSQAYVA